MRPDARFRTLAAVVLPIAALGAGCTGTATDDPAAAPATTVAQPAPAVDAAPLRAAAEERGVLVGTAADPARIAEEPGYTDALAAHFSSLTPENAMKWPSVQPERDVWRWDEADALVDLAEEHGMGVRGHTLVWGQEAGNGMPDWVAAIEDPAELEAVMVDHIDTVVSRYRGRIDRWDVVNEPLVYAGGGLDENPFQRLLGEEHLALAFETAHRADPEASLWLNETGVLLVPGKPDEVVALAQRLVDADVPIDGVGIQGHLFAGEPPPPGLLYDTVTRLRALGLEVAITELDVPLTEATDAARQAEIYRQVVDECLGAGCSEITVWGVHDGQTWLDDFLDRDGTAPLLLDEALEPKLAYDAVVDRLRAG